jgi:predicted nucleotide-binding protein
MINVAGQWEGEFRGTNIGRVTMNINQKGGHLSGNGTFFEPSLGRYEYKLDGAVLDSIEALLTSLPNQKITGLGTVTIKGKLNQDNEIEGLWQSSNRSNGSFILKKSVLSHQHSEKKSNKSVFLAHGHNELVKEKVAGLLRKLGLEVIILHEQASSGRTIIEKLEHYAASVGYAVALFTADDLGNKKNDNGPLRDRARQNVVLELGYFVGKLKRENVCLLHEDGVELPSDILSVTYISLGSSSWEFQLVKELKAAGYSIDANKL